MCCKCKLSYYHFSGVKEKHWETSRTNYPHQKPRAPKRVVSFWRVCQKRKLSWSVKEKEKSRKHRRRVANDQKTLFSSGTSEWSCDRPWRTRGTLQIHRQTLVSMCRCTIGMNSAVQGCCWCLIVFISYCGIERSEIFVPTFTWLISISSFQCEHVFGLSLLTAAPSASAVPCSGCRWALCEMMNMINTGRLICNISTLAMSLWGCWC